jgi:hypothetical protein
VRGKVIRDALEAHDVECAAMIGSLRSLLLRVHEFADQGCYFVGFGIEGEVARFQYVDLGLGYVFAVAFGLAGIEGQVVFAPEDEEAGLRLLHPCLPFWIGVDIGAVVVKEVALNLGLAGGVEEGVLVGP